MISAPEIFVLEAGPRMRPKPLPVFPNPPRRPEGDLEPLVLRFFSEVSKGIDIAMGRVPQRNTAAFLNAIRNAGAERGAGRHPRNIPLIDHQTGDFA